MQKTYDPEKKICDLQSTSFYSVGMDDVSKIVLSRDGAGPMGWFDVIHIWFGDDEWPGRSMPAHSVGFWS